MGDVLTMDPALRDWGAVVVVLLAIYIWLKGDH